MFGSLGYWFHRVKRWRGGFSVNCLGVSGIGY